MPNATYLPIVQKYYPMACTSTETVSRVFDIVYQQLGLRPHHLLHADSLCSDDINSYEYPQKAYDMVGPFKMGGLDGFPFCGLSGMDALAHHVPKDGAALIFYAPHIGISKQGEFGAVTRSGQHHQSACCGALATALEKLQSNNIDPNSSSELDYQQHKIEHILYREKDRILQADVPLYEATEVMYEAIGERIDELVEKTTFDCPYVVIAGGIMINGDHDMGSFCTYRRLDCLDLETGKVTDFKPFFYKDMTI